MSTPKFIFLQDAPVTPAAGTDWEMWSAIATVLAVLVALGLPFVMRWLDNRDRAAKTRLRTVTAGPEIAADVMQVDWQLVGQVRVVKQFIGHHSAVAKAIAFDEKLRDGTLLFSTFPGRTLAPGDREHLADDVRQVVAELHAQVLATNAMWRQLLNGPFGRFQGPAAAVDAMLPELMHQLCAVHNSCNRLMDSLRPYLPEQLVALGDSIANQERAFAAFAQLATETKQTYLQRQAQQQG